MIVLGQFILFFLGLLFLRLVREDTPPNAMTLERRAKAQLAEFWWDLILVRDIVI